MSGDVFARDYTIFRQRDLFFFSFFLFFFFSFFFLVDYCHDRSIVWKSFGHYTRIKEEVLAICRMASWKVASLVSQDFSNRLDGNNNNFEINRATCKYFFNGVRSSMVSHDDGNFILYIRGARRIFWFDRIFINEEGWIFYLILELNQFML